DVIALNENTIIQSVTMVHPAAEQDGVFFQHAQTWHRLACIGDSRVCSFDRLNELSRDGRNAGKMLKQVQRNAFAGEQYISKTARARDDFARFDLFAVRCKCFELLLWIECGKDFLSSFE